MQLNTSERYLIVRWEVIRGMKQILMAHTFGIGMKVSHGRSKVNMPHLLLDRKDSRSRVHQVCRQRVPEKVRVDALFDPGTYQCVVNNAN